MFIDESDKQKSSENSNELFFSLTGVIIDSDNLISLENDIFDFKSELKEKYQLESLKELRRTLKIRKEDKLQATKKIVSILTKHNLKVISIVISHPERKTSKKAVADNYLSAISFIVERFYLHIKKQKTTGIIIHDSLSDSKVEKLVSDSYNKNILTKCFFDEKSKLFKKKIYPLLFFANDVHSNLLQVSDLISSSMINAYYEYLKTDNKKINEICDCNIYLKEYWDLYEKNPKNGEVDGWGIKIW